MARTLLPFLLCSSLLLAGCLSATDQPSGQGDGGSGANAPPSFDLILPLAEIRVAVGVQVQIIYVDDDPDDVATTDLFADADGDLTTTADQRVIGQARADSNGLQQDLLWDTTGAPPGNYKIVARSKDANHDAVISVGRGSVTVVDSPIVLENLQGGTELRYDTAYLAGTVKGGATSILVERGGVEQTWPVVAGRFKALTSLAPGDNEVNLTVNGIRQSVSLRYAVSTNRRFVRLVYMLGSDGDGQFDAPAGEPHDLASAVARLQTAGRLMQTMFAERMNAQGLGRRTFRLETDSSGVPIVRVIRSSMTVAQLRALPTGGDLFNQFKSELASQPSRADSLDVVISGVTHFDPVSGTTVGDGATRVTPQVMYGSSNLHTWAASLSEVVRRWTDTRRIDTAALRDDSVGRGTYWGNYATGLGVVQWMLSDLLGLQDSNDVQSLTCFPPGIRNYDWVNRTFMMQEPASPRVAAGLSPLLPAQEIGLDKSSAILLHYHRWMAPSDVSYTTSTPPTITSNGTTLSVSGSAGLRLVTYAVAGTVIAHEEFLATPPPSFSISLATLKSRLSNPTSIVVAAEDDQGNMARSTISLP